MSTKRTPPPALICVNCGDELTIAGAFLPSGPLCADCAPDVGQEPTAPTNNPPEGEVVPPRETEGQPRDRAADNNGKIGIESEARDLAAYGPCDFTGCLRVKGHGSFHTTIEGVAKHQDEREQSERALLDPRSFHPEPGADSLVLEVEEWVWLANREFPLATPVQVSLPLASVLEEWVDLPRSSRFVVVLEWERGPGGLTMRDIGPSFGGDRQLALVEAMAFARGQARRLKAVGPFGYRPAREIAPRT